jgi:tetraacyldisaccharide 4'-kinase
MVTGQRWLAFAGIGNPDKFYASLAQAGGTIAETRSFPDHHSFEPDEIRDLIDTARRNGLGLITTAKDHVRLATMVGVPAEFLSKLAVLDIDLKFERTDALNHILDTVIERFKSRSL